MNYIGNQPAPDGVYLVGDTAPIGSIVWAHAVPDGSYLRLNGQVVAKATFPDLWLYAQGFLTADQTLNPGLFRSIDAATFALPKFDGLFVRSQGQVDANHVSAALGVQQADQNQAHVHSQRGAGAPGGSTYMQAASTLTGLQNFNATDTQGGTEARPINVALIPCIKAMRTLTVPTIGAPASPADMEAGTAADKLVTPGVMKYGPNTVKATVNFNGTGVVAIRKAYNVSSITDNGVGDYTINIAIPLASANYACNITVGSGTNCTSGITADSVTARTASLVRMFSLSGSSGTDSPTIGVSIVGD